MPLTAKGETIKKAMQEEYGEKRGEAILYASKNAGTVSGIDSPVESIPQEISAAEIAEANKKFWWQQMPQSPIEDEVMTPTHNMGAETQEYDAKAGKGGK